MDEIETRFWEKVDKNGSFLPGMATRCWEWTGGRDTSDRPRFWLRDNSVPAQRAALILAGRPLKSGEHAAAVCGNRLCVRPGHLVAATLRECQALRGRGPHPLGSGDVWIIRESVRGDPGTIGPLAETVGVRPGFLEALAQSQ